ncbi:MAG: endonuclease/exonuclease/phosphatase family protein [Myxococcales bacterium]|nr:endonuclease/exonuclease/phosphatase family protein [Myxococcales bacterium]
MRATLLVRALILTLALSAATTPAHAKPSWRRARTRQPLPTHGLLADSNHAGKALARIGRASRGLRVMWWNIQYGAQNDAAKGRPLDHNLRALTRSALSPDVVLLGEFESHAISPAVRAELDKRYPYRHYVALNDAVSQRGIQVFSKHPLDAKHQERWDYVPAGADAKTAEAYRADWRSFRGEKGFPRRYIRLTVKHPQTGKAIDILPIHTAQPWDRYTEQASVKALGKARVAYELLAGGNNPLMHQLRRLRGKLERDYGKDLDRKPMLMLGDFNLPRGRFGIRSRAYRLTRRNLSDAFTHWAPSWPASTAGEYKGYPKLKIDHAFTGGDLSARAAEVLPIKGSDHYPIYVVVE